MRAANEPDKGEDETKPTHQSWTKYEDKLNDLQENYDKKINKLDNRKVHFGDKKVSSDDIVTGIKILEHPIRNRLAHGVYKIIEHISTKKKSEADSKRKRALQALDRVFKTNQAKHFHNLKCNPVYGLVEHRNILTTKKRVIEEQVKESTSKLALQLINNIVRRKVFQYNNNFFNKVTDYRPDQGSHQRVIKLIKLLSTLVLKRTGPAFKAIHGLRKKVYSESSCKGFDDMLKYFVANKLSQGFSSIRSYVMHFEVLKVEQIDQDDFYKNKMMEAMDKFKAGASFELPDPNKTEDGQKLPDNILLAEQFINALNPNPGRGSARFVDTKVTK
mgnify:CR=1 FL=1